MVNLLHQTDTLLPENLSRPESEFSGYIWGEFVETRAPFQSGLTTFGDISNGISCHYDRE